jgi:hypothetical protein
MSTEPEGTAPEPQTLAVPLNADGSIGTLPDPLQKFVDSRIRQATQRAKAPDPVDSERLKTLEGELEQYRIKDAEAGKRYAEAIQIRDEREAKERERLQAELTRRTDRLTQAARTEVKAEALRLGARDESLDELVALLGTRISLNDDLEVVVDGADSIAALVAGYLDTKPHHRKAGGGQAMGAQGGAVTQTGAVGTPVDAAVAAIHARIATQGRVTGKDVTDLAAARAGGRA